MNKQTKKRVFLFLILGAFLIYIIPFVSAQETFEIIFDNFKITITEFTEENIGDTPKDIIVGLIITLIIFAGLYDMVVIIGLFQHEWVRYTIAGGITLIGIMFGFVRTIVEYGAGFAAALGAIGIILEIVIISVIFIFLVFGAQWASKFAAKRKAGLKKAMAIEDSAEIAAGIKKIKAASEA
jgi:hypothetical protein